VERLRSRPAGEGPNERECSRPCRCGEHRIRCLQMPAEAGRSGVGRGEAACGSGSDEARRPRHELKGTGSALLLAALTRENLQRAWKRVRANKGVAGVDGLDIDQTAAHLRMAWPAIREQLLSGTRTGQSSRARSGGLLNRPQMP
jgi:hypothetical protein